MEQEDEKITPKTVRDWMRILAECDPDAVVSLSLPYLGGQSDKAIAEDPDPLGVEYSYSPQVTAGILTSKDNYAEFFDENNRWRDGVKPNCVTIALTQEDSENLLASRKRAIERDHDSDGMEPEPVVADAETVIVDVRIPRNVHASIRTLLHRMNSSHQVKVEQACTHGLLTVAGALEMLAQDLGMVETRPGSWEGSNLAQVLHSHGYTS